jgi:hypothetical protein
LEAKKMTAIATTTAAVSAIALAGETNNPEDTVIMCLEEMTRPKLR